MSGTASGNKKKKRSDKRKRLQNSQSAAPADEAQQKTSEIMELMEEVMDLKHRVRKYEQLTEEMQRQPVKQTFLSRLFWPGCLCGLIYVLKDLAESDMNWYRFTGILVAIPSLFVLLGVFILYSSSSMDGESFLKLIKLSLKINLSGIQSLLKKKK